MNEHQRKMARKAGKSSGYAHGGVVGKVSHAMEMLPGEKSRNIKAAEEEAKAMGAGQSREEYRESKKMLSPERRPTRPE
jgi:hypothetical protein